MITAVGQFIEYQVTGQREFQLTIPFTGAKTIDTHLEGKLQMSEVRKRLHKEFRITTTWPVLLEIKMPPPRGWKAGFYHAEGNIGRYETHEFRSEKTHQITIKPGLARPMFEAVLAHEITHAYQAETNLLNHNPALREGMARWVEYHFLAKKHPKQAEKLLSIRHYTFGKAIQTIVEHEKKHGRENTIKWLLTL